MNDPERLFPATASPIERGSGKRSQTQARTVSGKQWETVGNSQEENRAPGALGPDVVDDQGAAADLKPIAAIDWDARLRAAVAETLWKRARRKAERQELNTRRRAGLAARHAAKLARGRTTDQPQDDKP